MSDWKEKFITPQFAVALIAEGIFLYAFAEDPSDATMKGAIIGGFNLALGFYLGATSTGQKSAENTGDAFRAITATANANNPNPSPDVVLKPGETAQASTNSGEDNA